MQSIVIYQADIKKWPIFSTILPIGINNLSLIKRRQHKIIARKICGQCSQGACKHHFEREGGAEFWGRQRFEGSAKSGRICMQYFPWAHWRI